MKPKFQRTVRRRLAREAALASAIVISLSSASLAVDNLWTGGSTDWNTATNWSLGRVPTNANGATEGDTFDDAVINTTTPNIVVITANPSATPRDIVVGSGAEATGRLDHTAGTIASGPGNWMYVGRNSATGTYNLANTGTIGEGVSGFAQGSGSLNANGRLYVGGWNSPGTGTFNVNTTGTLAIAYQLQVGNGTGTGVFNLESGTVTTGSEWVEFGNGAGSNGTLNMSGGSFTKGGNDHFSIGTNAGNGTGNITGGSLTVNNEIWVGQASGSLGVLNFSGGTISNNSYVAIGREGGTGNVNMTGGTWTKTGGGYFIVGASGPGSMIQSGGIVNVLSGDTVIGELNGGNGSFTLSDTGEFRATYFQIGRNAGSTGTANLTGGTLRVSQIAGGAGTKSVYFDGTQIIATGHQTSFISNIAPNQATIGFGGLKIDSNGCNLGVPQVLSGFGGVIKSGAGTLTLTGANIYEGGNTVNAGKLVLSTASTLNGDCAVADGAGFGVLQADPSATLTVPNATFGTSAGASLDIDLGNVAGNPSVAPLTVSGTLALNGTVTVNIADSFPNTGSIPLVSYTVPKSGFGGFVLGSLPPGTVGTMNDDGLGLVSLNLTQVTLLEWKGVSGASIALWDIGTTNDWKDKVSGLATTYTNPGAVLFNDNGLSSRISLNVTVAPGKVTFNNSSVGSYRLQGTGKITGTATLLKQGTGNLLIFNTTPNDYTGPTILEGGITSAPTLANGGSPSSIGASSPTPSNLVLAGGILSYTGTTATSSNRGFTISGPNSGISASSDLTLGGQAVCTTGNLTKTGAGKLVLTHPGANSFGTVSPGLRVSQSTVDLIGSGTQTNTVGGDCWIGHTTSSGANLTLSSTSLAVQSWLVLGRGNGNTGLTSTLTATDSTISTGNVTTGYIGTETLNNSNQTITLTNTTWTNAGVVQLAESAGSTTTMTMAGTSSLTTAGALRMAMGTGTSTVNLTIQDTASVTKNGGWLAIGDGGTAKATVTVKNSGSLVSTIGDFNIGDGGTSQGTLNLSDTGTVSSTGIAFIGKGSGTKGTFNQTGGTFTGQSWISIGRYTGAGGNATGTVNISGGTFNQTNPANSLIVGEDGTGTLTISGTGAVTSLGTVLVSNSGTAIGTLNLNGGTLTTRQVSAGATGAGLATFNFNGGILRAGTGANAIFMDLLDVVNVQAGGALIDTNGQTVSINQSLQDGGGGLTKSGVGTLYLNGLHSYTGATQIAAGTLAGTGDFVSPITVANGANLNPGAPGGTLYGTTVTFATGSTLTVDMAQTVDTLQAETLDITGAALVLNGTPTLPVHVLARYTSLTGHFTSVPTLPAGYTLNYDFTGNGGHEIALTREADGYETWAQSRITAINPSADASAGGDPDGDGRTNVAEFALDGDPLSGANDGKVVGKIATVGGSPAMVLTLPVRNSATFSGTTEQVSALIDGVIYRIQGSDNLTAWNLAVSEVTNPAEKLAIEGTMPQPLNAGWTYRTFRSPGAVTGDPMDYLRAVITKP